MKALVRHSDGLIQLIQVYEYESSDRTEVELPGSIEVPRGDRKVKVVLNRITGEEWREVPEYIEQASA